MDDLGMMGGDFVGAAAGWDEGDNMSNTPQAADSGWAGAQMATGSGPGLKPVSVLIGLIGLLVIMRVVGESDKTDIQPSHLHIGPYNLIGVTVTAIVGIALAKLLFNKFHVPGVTDLVNAV